jgi:hypothetical protein
MAINNSRARAVRLTALAVAAGAAAIWAGVSRIEAHKGITSKYTYNDDVYPILRDKCGRCHTEGGPTSMSLLNYNSDNGGAVAWAESIREMLVSEAMPPYYADPSGPQVRNQHSLTPRELDIVVTWATGGTPQGDLNKKPVTIPFRTGWTLGKPDVELKLDAQTIPVGAMDKSVDLKVPTKFTEAKWIKAADLLAGTPSIVRRARIAVADGPVLALWEPGDEIAAAPGGASFKVPAGAVLDVHVDYKKSWLDEQSEKSDTSTIGLYFGEEPLSGKSIEAVVIDGPSGAGEDAAKRVFSGTMTKGGRVLGFRPLVDQAYASLEIAAVSASGRRVPLLKMRGPRPEWPRRYWLVDPVELAANTKIEITTTPGDPDTGPLMKSVESPLQIALDILPQ